MKRKCKARNDGELHTKRVSYDVIKKMGIDRLDFTVSRQRADREHGRKQVYYNGGMYFWRE